MNKRILLRADGFPQIGYGHIFRVLALAERLQGRNSCLLVTSSKDQVVYEQASKLGLGIISVPEFEYTFPEKGNYAEEIPYDLAGIVSKSDTVVLDGYWFGASYQRQVRLAAGKVILIDDLMVGPHHADVIVNHSPGVDPSSYLLEGETRLCLGLDFLILRSAFFRQRSSLARPRKAVYLSFGGADLFGLTYKFLSLCTTKTDEIEAHVLMSSSFNSELINHLEELRCTRANIYLHRNLSGDQVADLIDHCTHAVTASSTVALEVVARGIKPLIGYYSDNQRGIYKSLLKENLAFGLGNLMDDVAVSVNQYLDEPVFHQRKFDSNKLLDIFE